MPSNEIHDGSSDAAESEANEQLYDIVGITAGVGQLLAFSIVGLTALDSLRYGVVAGVMTGVGSYLFLPWFMRLSAAGNDSADELSFSELLDRVPARPQPAVFGFGLDSGGVVMVAAGFVVAEPNLLIGAGVGVAWALVVFLIGTVWLDWSNAQRD